MPSPSEHHYSYNKAESILCQYPIAFYARVVYNKLVTQNNEVFFYASESSTSGANVNVPFGCSSSISRCASSKVYIV